MTRDQDLVLLVREIEVEVWNGMRLFEYEGHEIVVRSAEDPAQFGFEWRYCWRQFQATSLRWLLQSIDKYQEHRAQGPLRFTVWTIVDKPTPVIPAVQLSYGLMRTLAPFVKLVPHPKGIPVSVGHYLALPENERAGILTLLSDYVYIEFIWLLEEVIRQGFDGLLFTTVNSVPKLEGLSFSD